jgi:copper resistance protein C
MTPDARGGAAAPARTVRLSRGHRRRGMTSRFLAIVATAGLVLLGSAGPALAHNTLVSSDPQDGARLTTGPARITLTFDQPVNGGFNTITLTGPDGRHWNTGDVTTSGNAVSTAVLPLGPAGEYVTGYRVVSADGHPVSGTVRFELTQAGTGTPAPPASSSPGTAASQGSNGGTPVWPWIAIAIAVLAAGVFLALRLGRPTPPE